MECKEIGMIRDVLRRLPKKYESFPSLSEIHETIYQIKLSRKMKEPEVKEVVWVSKRAPGTPACVEAVFLLLEQGKSELSHFDYGKRFCGFKTDKQLFDAYEAFVDGKIHPDFKEMYEGLMGLPFISRFIPSKSVERINLGNIAKVG